MLSKILTLSWVQSHVGVIMGRKIQERWIEGTEHKLFTREPDMGGEREREKAVFLHFCTSIHQWQHPKQMHSPFEQFVEETFVCSIVFFFFCLFLGLFASVVFFTPLLSHQSFPLEAALPLTNNNTFPAGSVWWPTLHSLWMQVQQAYMSCVHKLWCKWLEQKGGAAVLGWKWKCAPL